MWLFALFLLVPLIEIALFITVGGWLTLWPTLGLVLLTGIIGTALMRWQGMQVLAELRGDMGNISNPLSPLAHGALILVAGLLLLTPGFFTDTLGLLLMIPRVRSAIISQLGSRIEVMCFGGRTPGMTAHRHSPDHGPVIDGEFFEIDENEAPKGPSKWTRH